MSGRAHEAELEGLRSAREAEEAKAKVALDGAQRRHETALAALKASSAEALEALRVAHAGEIDGDALSRRGHSQHSLFSHRTACAVRRRLCQATASI
jgi:hypothetical protein